MRRAVFSMLAAAGVLAGCGAEPRDAPSGAPDRAPRRVVALAPNLTEIVFALGGGDALVGASEHSDFPEAARRVPRVGGLQVDPERVAALRPDLVLAAAEGRARSGVAALQAAGVPVLVTPSGSLDAVLESIRLVGNRLGRTKQAAALVADLSRRRAAVAERVRGRARRRALLLIWPDPPQAAGGGTFLGDLLEEAGGENVVGERRGWPVLSVEHLATAGAEVIVVPDSSETREAWERAFASGALSRGPSRRAKVIRIDESVLTRPGPRAFDALERLEEGMR